ncbi:unnamed protein product [Staurois parvus]|uniref:Uncharacterized protein n=1 Tax=Staurois parvus TaxID=386267 RepID=A0ABN9CL81_9NEOB|nr:unnamed protein product [Staurois parvus]
MSCQSAPGCYMFVLGVALFILRGELPQCTVIKQSCVLANVPSLYTP